MGELTRVSGKGGLSRGSGSPLIVTLVPGSAVVAVTGDLTGGGNGVLVVTGSPLIVTSVLGS